MKTRILIVIFYFALTSFTTNSEEKSNGIIQDTIKDKEQKKEPFISLQGTNCIEKGTFQIFTINNVDTSSVKLALSLSGATGKIVAPQTPEGNGQYRINISKEKFIKQKNRNEKYCDNYYDYFK